MTIARTIATWALGRDPANAPKQVRRAATRHLIDGLGCALAATRRGEMRAAVLQAERDAGDDATVAGTAIRASAPFAALAMGALVHALDFDDTHTTALVHATAAVLPAAFAVAEQTDASDDDLLAACIAGYEVVIALGAAVPHGFHARGFHATSVCGIFAAAAITARLTGMTVEQTVNALGIAGSMAAGSLAFLETGSSTKQLHPGLSAMNGILAARLAADGADGPDTIFEAENGLFRAYAGASVTDLAGLGSTWETPNITIKPYPACQLSHASLDALRATGLTRTEIDTMRVLVPKQAAQIVCHPRPGKLAPRTPYEGKFSLPYSLAALAIDGALTVDSFDPDQLARPDVLALASKVSIVERDYDAPPATAPGQIEVGTADGRIVTGESAASTIMSDADLLAKYDDNARDADPGPYGRALLETMR